MGVQGGDSSDNGYGTTEEAEAEADADAEAEPQPQPQPQPQQQQHQQPKLSPAPPLPPAASAWAQHLDPASGRPYWHNPSTGVTTWNNPEPDGDCPHTSSHDSIMLAASSTISRVCTAGAGPGEQAPAASVELDSIEEVTGSVSEADSDLDMEPEPALKQETEADVFASADEGGPEPAGPQSELEELDELTIREVKTGDSICLPANTHFSIVGNEVPRYPGL